MALKGFLHFEENLFFEALMLIPQHLVNPFNRSWIYYFLFLGMLDTIFWILFNLLFFAFFDF